jgi:putative FmdB family regulatory protein
LAVPTYVYACKECDDRTEVIQKMSDAPLTECGKCGGHLRRVLFPPAVVYKGSGFYVTDYKNGGRKPESESSSTASEGKSEKESKSETKSEAKTESKTESKSEAPAKTETTTAS